MRLSSLNVRLYSRTWLATSRVARPLAVLLVLLGPTACLTAPEGCGPAQPSDPATETFAASLEVDLASMSRTLNGVYRRDIVAGDGEQLTVPRRVEVRYVAYLKDGTLVDSRVDQTVQMDLRDNAIVFGLVDGMMGMNVGGTRLLVVPSDLALGACGRETIPANSTIVYRIELVSLL